MPASKAQIRATNKYNASAYDRLNIVVPKGQKATIEAAAKEAGESINQYTQKALLARMGLSEWPVIEEKQKPQPDELPDLDPLSDLEE